MCITTGSIFGAGTRLVYIDLPTDSQFLSLAVLRKKEAVRCPHTKKIMDCL